MVGAIRDITERKQAEESLQFGMEYFRLHSDLAKILIKIPSSELGKTIESFLERIAKFFDFDRATLIYRPEVSTNFREVYSWKRDGVENYCIPDQYEELSYSADIIRNGQVYTFSDINELPSEAQAEKDYYLSAGIKSAIRIPMMIEGRMLGILVFDSCGRTKEWNDDLIKSLQLIAQTFTHCFERKHGEEILRDSEDKLRAIFENVNDEIVYLDGRGMIIDVNKRIKDIFGYSPEEVIGKHISEISFCRPESLKNLTELYEKGASGSTSNLTELIAERKDGTEIFLESNTRVIKKDGEMKNILVVIRDITERKKLEDRLQQAQRMEAIGALSGGVAHDLNNILSGVVSYPELLLINLPEDSPLRKPILTIKKSGEKAASIVNDLLTLARRGVVISEVVNLNDVISEYLESPEYEKLKSYHPHIGVETNLQTDLLNIQGSPVHLSKSIMNLVSNAAEAMTEWGTISISTENRYLDRPLRSYDHIRQGDYVALTISDTGEGISSQDLKRIFEPFYTKKVMGRSGTGLGMAVVWGTVKDHKGYIDIETAEGNGTKITLYFPVTRKKMVKDESRFSIEDYMGNGESVLVVDDVEEQRLIASELLRELNYSVTAVSSGEQAVEYMKDHSVDILVLDMIMDPGIDGLETYKRIVELHPQQNAIIASGYTQTAHVKEAQKLGAGKYVKKPYSIENIGMAIKAALTD